jgi:16S rRNA (adenine1518-N6/adenine1519-N6)-dimethyltransferase
MKYSKKSLGQNFLIDKNIIKKIINLLILKNKNIVEIGPGNGALTDEIIKKSPKSLIIVEKDLNLSEKLKIKYTGNKFIKIYNNDILKLDIEKIINKNSIIIGNLPYNISSQILVKFLKFNIWPPKFKDIIFMFQKELGEKIIGQFLSPQYGRLSIFSNYRLSVINKFLVSPNCFIPKPKVVSMVIHFKPKSIAENFKIKNINNLEKITHFFFSNKRKMINKNIRKLFENKKIKNISGLEGNLRPSEIRPEIYYKITEIYEKS